MDFKTITAKTDELEGDLLTAYASVQVVDMENDVVDIDGIDLSYHSPDSPIKIFSEHIYSAPDGVPTVIGRAEFFEKTFYKNTNIPALKFKMSWAKKPDGGLTDLARAYKELFETGYLDSFSVGLDRVEGEKNEQGGVNWTKTKLIEVSAASIPANQNSNVIKSILNKYNIRVKNMASDNIESLNPVAGGAGQGTYGTYKDMGSDMQMHMQKCMDHMTKCHDDMKDHVTKCFKDMNDRMDDMESTMAASGEPEPEVMSKSHKTLKDLEDKKKKDLEVKAQEESLKEINKQLAELRKAMFQENEI